MTFLDAPLVRLRDIDRPGRLLNVITDGERVFLGVDTGTKRAGVEVSAFELAKALFPRASDASIRRALGRR